MSLFIIYLLISISYLALFNHIRKKDSLNRHWGSTALFLTMTLHAYTLIASIFTPLGTNLGVFNILSLISMLTVLVYWFTDSHQQLSRLLMMALFCAAILSFIPYLRITDHYVILPSSPLFVLHIVIAMLAYSFAFLTALHAGLMLVLNHSLHRHMNIFSNATSPSLMELERLLFNLLKVSFVLLSITLFSGMVFSEQLFDKATPFTHKTIFSIASWMIYAILLWGHYRYGWRGIKAIRFILFGFALLLLSYIGSQFVLEVLLHR